MLIYNYKILIAPVAMSNPQKGSSPSTAPSTSHVVYTHVHMDAHPYFPSLANQQRKFPAHSPFLRKMRVFQPYVPPCWLHNCSHLWVRPAEQSHPHGVTLAHKPLQGGRLLLVPHRETALPGPERGRGSLCGCCCTTCFVSPPLQIFFYTSFHYMQL